MDLTPHISVQYYSRGQEYCSLFTSFQTPFTAWSIHYSRLLPPTLFGSSHRLSGTKPEVSRSDNAAYLPCEAIFNMNFHLLLYSIAFLSQFSTAYPSLGGLELEERAAKPSAHKWIPVQAGGCKYLPAHVRLAQPTTR